MAAALAFILRLLSGPTVDRVVAYMEKRADLQGREARLRTDVEIATLKQSVEMASIMSRTETARYGVGWYWLFVGLFVVPLSLWWLAVILDSIFYFAWDVAALPAPLDEWAGAMIGWLFIAGGVRTMIGGRR